MWTVPSTVSQSWPILPYIAFAKSFLIAMRKVREISSPLLVHLGGFYQGSIQLSESGLSIETRELIATYQNVSYTLFLRFCWPNNLNSQLPLLAHQDTATNQSLTPGNPLPVLAEKPCQMPMTSKFSCPFPVFLEEITSPLCLSGLHSFIETSKQAACTFLVLASNF